VVLISLFEGDGLDDLHRFVLKMNHLQLDGNTFWMLQFVTLGLAKQQKKLAKTQSGRSAYSIENSEL
jgi:hypothetical protein